MLSPFSRKAPELLSAEALQHSCLPRKNVDHLSPRAMRLCSSGSRFFSPQVRHRDWHTLSRIRAQSAHRLPAVRSLAEGRRLLKAATPLHHCADFPTLSRLGLRLHEGLSRHGSDLDSPRLMVHVQRGNGAQDRDVPLPAEP